MLRLILVRHGITEWNLSGRRCGHTDVPLSPQGIAQAHAVCLRLRDEQIDAAYASDLCRARVTAEIISQPHGIDVVTTPLLREIDHGAHEGFTAQQAGPDDRAADSEPPEAVMQRVTQARKMIQAAVPEGTALVVAHLGPLRMLLCDAIGAPVETRRNFCMNNASISIIEWTANGARLRLVNETQYLAGI